MEAFLNLFEEIEELKTGYSKDRLFKCTDEYGDYHLCRFFKIKEMGKASEQYEVLKKLNNQTGFQQVEYILKCQDGDHGVLVYDWAHGINLDEYLQEYPNKQFELGQKSGKLLKQLHNLRIPHQFPIGYQVKQLKEIDKEIKKYLEIGGDFPGLSDLLEQYDQFKSSYKVEKLVQTHGDFQTLNMIVSDREQVTFIDFGATHSGDKSEDLSTILLFDEIDFVRGVFDSYQPTKQDLINTKVHILSSPRIILQATEHGSQDVEKLVKLCQQIPEKLEKLGL